MTQKMSKEEVWKVHQAVEKKMQLIKEGKIKTYTFEEVKKRASEKKRRQ